MVHLNSNHEPKKSWKISELHLERAFKPGRFTVTWSPFIPLLNAVFVTYVTDAKLILQADHPQHTARVIKCLCDPSHKHTETTSVHRRLLWDTWNIFSANYPVWHRFHNTLILNLIPRISTEFPGGTRGINKVSSKKLWSVLNIKHN